MHKYLNIGIKIATGLSGIAFLMTIFGINPNKSGAIEVGLLFSCLFFALAGGLFLGLSYLRKKKENYQNEKGEYKTFRHAFILALFIVGILLFNQINVLNIISLVFLFTLFLSVEIYFARTE